MHVRERTTTKPVTWQRSALRWLPTFLGFPLGGLVAEARRPARSTGSSAAVVGGAITGVILGAVQSWGLGTNGPPARQWIAATGAGFAVGLGVGAAAVGYGTSMGDLVVQGAICGLAIGTAQAVVLRPRIGGLAFAWVPTLSALWALGWAITTASGDRRRKPVHGVRFEWRVGRHRRHRRPAGIPRNPRRAELRLS